MFIKHYTHTPRVYLFAMKKIHIKEIHTNTTVTNVDFWYFFKVYISLKKEKKRDISYCVYFKEDRCVSMFARACMRV